MPNDLRGGNEQAGDREDFPLILVETNTSTFPDRSVTRWLSIGSKSIGLSMEKPMN